MTEYLIIISVIVVLSIVQSIFGMGLLVFGTPTMLMLGYDFITALGFLLPASFSISLLQVIVPKSQRVKISKQLYGLCLPAIGLGLWLTEVSPLGEWTNILIGGTLLLTSVSRLWPRNQKLFITFLEKQKSTFHFVMGCLHGMTNLGGALLAILASHSSSEKGPIRYIVAQYYLAFSLVQMTFLAVIMGHYKMFLNNIPLALISAAIYLLIGKRIFKGTSNLYYNYALTVFIASYGVVILMKFWLLPA